MGIKGQLMRKIDIIELPRDWDLEALVTRVIKYSHEGEILLHKFRLDGIKAVLTQEHLFKLMGMIEPNKTLNLLEMVRVLLNVIQHQPYETLYITCGLLQLYNQARKHKRSQERVSLPAITSVLCKPKQNLLVPWELRFKLLPVQSLLDKENIRDIDLYPPDVLQPSQKQCVTLSKQSCVSVRLKSCQKIFYNSKEKVIMTSNSVSSSFEKYNLNLSFKERVSPRINNSQEINICRIAYSDQAQRVGMHILNEGFAFIDLQLDYRKVIKFVEYQCAGIWYLDKSQQWLVSNNKGWLIVYNFMEDIRLQEKNAFRLQNDRLRVSQIVEIPYLKCMAVAYNPLERIQSSSNNVRKQKFKPLQKRITIWRSGGGKLLEIDMAESGFSSLQFSQNFQALIVSTYKNRIVFYKIQHQLNLVENIKEIVNNRCVTTLYLIPNSVLLLSGDDNGLIKLWNLKNCKCVQKIISTKISRITNFLFVQERNTLFVANGSLNSYRIQNYIPYCGPLKPLNVQIIGDSIVILTDQNIKKLSIKTGQPSCIIKLNDNDCQAQNFLTVVDQEYVVSTSSGKLVKVNQCGDQQNLSYKSSDIVGIFSNQEGDLLISCWSQGVIIAFKLENQREGQSKKLRELQMFKELNCAAVDFNKNMMALGCSNELLLFQLQYFKQKKRVRLQGSVVRLKFLQSRNVLLIQEHDFISLYLFNGNYNLLPLAKVSLSEEFDSFDLKDSTEQIEFFAKLKSGDASLQLASLADFPLTKFQSIQMPQPDLYKVCLEKNEAEGGECERLLSPSRHERAKVLLSVKRSSKITFTKILSYEVTYYLFGNDSSQIQILELSGEVVCRVDVNKPLPHVWLIDSQNHNRQRKRVMESLRVIQSIFSVFGSYISKSQQSKIKVMPFLRKIYKSEGSTQKNIGLPAVKVMQDQYKQLTLSTVKRAQLLDRKGLNIKEIQAQINLSRILKQRYKEEVHEVPDPLPQKMDQKELKRLIGVSSRKDLLAQNHQDSDYIKSFRSRLDRSVIKLPSLEKMEPVTTVRQPVHKNKKESKRLNNSVSSGMLLSRIQKLSESNSSMLQFGDFIKAHDLLAQINSKLSKAKKWHRT